MSEALVLFPMLFGMVWLVVCLAAQSTPRIREGIETYAERRQDGRIYVGTVGDHPGDWKYRMDRVDAIALRDQLNTALENES